MWARVVDDDPKERADPAQPRALVGRTWTWAVDSSLHGALKYPGRGDGDHRASWRARWRLACSSPSFRLVFALLLGLLVVFATATAGGSRVLEVAMLWVRGITIECGTCHVRATRPIYRCPECRAEHRKLLPGMAGVLHRTCKCETVLPTLLLNGKAKLPAQCAECKAQLPIGGLTAPTVHVPVIAGPTAGKSVYMFSAVSRLMLLGNGFEFADERAKQDFERNLQRGVLDDPQPRRQDRDHPAAGLQRVRRRGRRPRTAPALPVRPGR